MDPSAYFPPWIVMDCAVELTTELPAVDGEHEWAKIRCASRKAYGCGEHGQDLLDGLTLLARLFHNPDLATALCIHANAQARQIIRSELGAGDNEPIFQSIRGNVDLADENLAVLSLQLSYCPQLGYYLIYDAVGESLSMVPHMQNHHNARCRTVTPVPVRRRGEYGLLLVASVLNLRAVLEQRRRVFDDEALCVWHPAAVPPAADDDDLAYCSHIAPWQRKQRCVTSEEAGAFLAETVFSFQGRAFWADPSQGVLHCSDPLTDGGHSDDHVVELDFISLPPGCRVDHHPQMPPMEMFRTIGAVGDSIKFVSIDHAGDDIGARTVAVWSLQLECKRWTRDVAFSVRSLWELEGFGRAGLPETKPKCPVLTKDGALCLLLPNLRKRMEDSTADYICIVDISGKTVLWSGRLDNYNTTQPILLPSNFFKALHPLCQLSSLLSCCEI